MTQNWTHPLSLDDLYVITSNTTDGQTYDEALAEIDLRDEVDGGECWTCGAVFIIKSDLRHHIETEHAS